MRYAITPGTLTGLEDGETADSLLRRCRQLAAEGVDFLLVREKQLTAEELEAFSRQVVAVAAGSSTRVLVSGRADVARASGASGVHLGLDLPRAAADAAFPGAWISRSCHAVADVVRARELGADAVLFAPVFGKTVDGSLVVEGVGLEALRGAVEAAGDLPVFALGGVTWENAQACLRAGAEGIAGIRLFFGA
jgi:thiamine-phosphate pyrophosphorylase